MTCTDTAAKIYMSNVYIHGYYKICIVSIKKEMTSKSGTGGFKKLTFSQKYDAGIPSIDAVFLLLIFVSVKAF